MHTKEGLGTEMRCSKLLCPAYAMSAMLAVNFSAEGARVNFNAPLATGSGISPTAVAVGDFNGDGFQDLAVADGGNNGNTVTILLGTGTGVFSTGKILTVGSDPVGLVAADLNKDGNLDLAVVNYNSGTVSVMLGNGKGDFGPASNFNVGKEPYAVAVGDFNADGTPDLAVANYDSNNVSILLGEGNGTFKP